jgi:uncharacterized protein YycO
MDLTKVRPGMMMFEFHPWNVISEIIAFFTFPVIYNGILHHVSHAEIIVDVGNGGPADVQVMSAEASGTQPEWLQLSDIPFWVIKDVPSLSDLQRNEIVRWAWAHKGVPYNYFGLLDFSTHIGLDESNHLYCSQEVYNGFELDVDDFFKDPKCEGITLLKDVAWVSPAHLYTTPFAVTIGGI